MTHKRDELLADYERIKAIAEPLARLQEQAVNSSRYPHYDTSMALDKRGAIFYAHEQDRWEDHYNIEEILVTWEDIDNAEAVTKEHKRKIEAYKREQAKTQEEWQRKQYETLKARFEK